MNPELPEIVEAPSAPFWGYADLALFLGATLPSVVLAVFLVRAATSLWPRLLAAENSRALAIQIVAYLFLTGALYLVFSSKYRKPFWASLGWTVPIPRASSLIAAGPALAVALAALGFAMGIPAEPSQIESLITSRLWLAVWAFVGILLAPAFEETVFRGFLYPLLSRNAGPLVGIALTAIPFGLLHGAQNHWAWQPIVLIALAGAAFGYVRYRTGSTAAAFLLHAAYNATEFVLYAVTRWATLK